MAPCQHLSDFMEAVARKQKAEPPVRYGYKMDVDMGIGFYREEQTGCKVLEKPIVIPSGQPEFQGYTMLYAYCQEEGLKSLLQGGIPPVLPATRKEPTMFPSLAAIADNFGAKDPEAAKANSEFCVALRVPAEIATQAETPGRDIWMVQFNEDKISPFLQAAKEGDAAKVKAGLGAGIKGTAVDEHGVSALMMCAFAGSLDACQALLTSGAAPELTGPAAINYAEPGADRTALMFAAQGGHKQVVQALLAAGADAAKVDSEGQTALHWAAVAGKTDTAALLMGQKGVKNQQGQTPAEVAEKLGHAETAVALK